MASKRWMLCCLVEPWTWMLWCLTRISEPKLFLQLNSIGNFQLSWSLENCWVILTHDLRRLIPRLRNAMRELVSVKVVGHWWCAGFSAYGWNFTHDACSLCTLIQPFLVFMLEPRCVVIAFIYIWCQRGNIIIFVYDNRAVICYLYYVLVWVLCLLESVKILLENRLFVSSKRFLQ